IATLPGGRATYFARGYFGPGPPVRSGQNGVCLYYSLVLGNCRQRRVRSRLRPPPIKQSRSKKYPIGWQSLPTNQRAQPARGTRFYPCQSRARTAGQSSIATECPHETQSPSVRERVQRSAWQQALAGRADGVGAGQIRRQCAEPASRRRSVALRG